MTNRSEEYIQSLGEKLGFAVKPNENGTCLVTKGESPGVVVRANDESERMELSAAIAPDLPEGVAYSDMQDLLGMSLGPLFDAPGIGREPESGTIVMYALMPFATTTPADFADAVTQFLDRAQNLAERLMSLELKD